MERLLQTEVLEEIHDEINAELEARQNAKVSEQTPTNTGSPKLPPSCEQCPIAKVCITLRHGESLCVEVWRQLRVSD